MKIYNKWMMIVASLLVYHNVFATPPRENTSHYGGVSASASGAVHPNTSDVVYANDQLRDTFFNRRHIPDSCSVAKVEQGSSRVQDIQRDLYAMIVGATGGIMPNDFSQLHGARANIQAAYLVYLIINKYLGVTPQMKETLILQRYAELRSDRDYTKLVQRLGGDIRAEYERLMQDRRSRDEELTALNLWLKNFVLRNPGVTESLMSLNERDRIEFKTKQAQFELSRCLMIKDRALAHDLRKLRLDSGNRDSAAWSAIEDWAVDNWEYIKNIPSQILPAPKGFDKL